MQITRIDLYKYAIPMVPFTIATGTMHFAQNLLVRLHTDENTTGWGECSAFPMIVGETQNTCYEMGKAFAALWLGRDPLDRDQRLAQLDAFTARNYTAKSAFDLALFDLAAQAAGQPLYAYLGGQKKTITSDLTIGIDTPAAMAEQAIDFVQNRGVKTIKVKLGKDPETDIARIAAIREAIGYDTALRIDANQGWSPSGARKALQGLAPYQIEFCEQPMRTWEDDELPELCRLSPIPIMADESVYTHHDAERIIRHQACHSINIKFAKSGGIAEAQRIHAVAAQHQIPCMMGGMLESRLALSAKVHFAMAMPQIKYYDLDTCLLGHLTDPVRGGAQFQGMDLHLSEAPGIGAQVDPAFLDSLEQVSFQ